MIIAGTRGEHYISSYGIQQLHLPAQLIERTSISPAASLLLSCDHLFRMPIKHRHAGSHHKSRRLLVCGIICAND